MKLASFTWGMKNIRETCADLNEDISFGEILPSNR